MRRLIVITALFSLALATPVWAQETELRDFGEQLCWSAVVEGIDGIDPDIPLALEADDVEWVDLCSCVGQAFVDNAEHQMSLMATFAETEDEPTLMLSVIEANLSACLPSQDSDGDIGLDPFHPDFDLSEDSTEDDGEVLDGDLVDTDPLGYDPVDAMTCVEVIRGDFPARGFNSDKINSVIRKRGLDISAVCTCTAEWMAEQGEPLQDAIDAADAPGAEWGTALGRGIEHCVAR